MNNEKYSLIKDKQGSREGNTWYFHYVIVDNSTKKIVERFKSWYKTRPLTIQEYEKIPSAHLTVGIITEWEPNGLDNANSKLKILNYG